VLCLSRKNIRLLSGSRFRIEEVDLESQGVPISFTEALGELERRPTQQAGMRPFSLGKKGSPVFAGHGTTEDDLGAELRNFFERFDDSLAKIDVDRKAPVVLAGVEYLRPI